MGARGHRRAEHGEKLGTKGVISRYPRVEGETGLAITHYSDAGHDERSDRPKLADVLGPGLITGASDDDPSGIATYLPGRRTVRLCCSPGR